MTDSQGTKNRPSHSSKSGARTVKSVYSSATTSRGDKTYIVSETLTPVKTCTYELGRTSEDDDEEDDIAEGVDFEAFVDHIDHEIKLKASCKSLPYTVIFYFCFIWSAWLKCDTYNYGVGSSVADIFSRYKVSQADIGNIFKAENGKKQPLAPARMLSSAEVAAPMALAMTRESGEGSVPSSPRRLKAAGKGGDGAGGSGTSGVTSGETLWTYINHGVVPPLWNEGNGRVRRYHKIMGGLRIRQQRSNTAECESEVLRDWYTADVTDSHKLCRVWGSKADDAFGVNASMDEAFLPSPVKEGFYEVQLSIQASIEATETRLSELWKAGWLDYRTAKVILEVGLYNGDVDAFAFAQDEFQFRSDGSVHHKLRVATANNLFRRWYYYVADCMLWILIAILLIQEIIEVVDACRTGTIIAKYLDGKNGFWNLGDWASMILGIVVLLGYIYLDGQRGTVIDMLAQEYTDDKQWSETLDVLGTLITEKKLHEVFLFLFALCIMVRFFKSFRGQPRLAVLSTTLAMCLQEVMYFLIIFFVVFSNFVITGFLLFNSQIEAWSTLTKAVNECFMILMAEFDFETMYNVHPFAASLWFWAYMIIVLLIILSMLLAVILETYSVAKIQLANESSLGLLTQMYYLFLQSRLWRTMSRGTNRSKDAWMRIEDIRTALDQMEQNQRVALLRTSKVANQGKVIVFKVTHNTLAIAGIPQSQAKFFWKVFKPQLDAAKEAADLAPPVLPEHEDLPPVLSTQDAFDRCERLESRLAVQEMVLSDGLKEIFAKLAELERPGA